MDNNRGGGGRTPRGRKGRGRGRGGPGSPYGGGGPGAGAGDSPTPTSRPSPSASASSPSPVPAAATASPLSGSSSVSSPQSQAQTQQQPPKVTTTPTRDDNEQLIKVIPTPAERKPQQPEIKSRPGTMEKEVEKEPDVVPTGLEGKPKGGGDKPERKVSKEPEDKKEEEEEVTKSTESEKKVEEEPKVPPPVTKPESEGAKAPPPQTPTPEPEPQKKVTTPTPSLEELQEPTIVPIIPSPDSGPSKVQESLGKGPKPPKQAKTLVVEPPPLERSTDAPLIVEISDASASGGQQGQGGPAEPSSRPSSSASFGRRDLGRSGSMSPAQTYALIGPLGKPGYIGGVGIPGDEGDGVQMDPRQRRASAIAAVETAVKGFSKRQWILLIMFGIVDLLSAVSISLQAPFYPAEAEKKGATATEYGFVFGIFEFIVFLFSPIFGKYMHRLGPKTVFNVCVYLTSVAVICFGLLDRIQDHTTFIAVCLVCRVFEAVGTAGFFTATFCIIAQEFPESVATTFASLETFFGLGMIIGPTVGGALFDVGGFPLPFFVVGGCLLVFGFASAFAMPKMCDARVEDPKEQGRSGILEILKIPTIFLAAISIASTSMSLGFVSAVLEPHIRMFNLTPLQTGLVFIVNGGVYALTAPIFGYICDYINRPIFMTVVGNILVFTAFLLIGPAAFMPFDTILWVTIIGLVIQGFGFGCCLVSGFIVGLQDSMKNGFPDNMATYGVASGLWTSMISLGAFIGPILAGILYDNFGFRQGSYLILCTSALVGLSIFIHTCCDSARSSSSDSESEPLLRPISPLVQKKDVEAQSPTPKPSTSYGTS